MKRLLVVLVMAIATVGNGQQTNTLYAAWSSGTNYPLQSVNDKIVFAKTLIDRHYLSAALDLVLEAFEQHIQEDKEPEKKRQVTPDPDWKYPSPYFIPSMVVTNWGFTTNSFVVGTTERLK